MDEKRRKLAVWTALGTVLWFSLMTGMWLYMRYIEREVYERRANAVVPKTISDRMNSYHGTDVAYISWNGRIYFEREGQKCKF